MPLYYIAGISGAGKSTVLSELSQQGYEAYDVDVAGPVTAKWHNDITGYVHPKSSVKAAARTPEFIATHSWRVQRQEVEELARQAGDNPVFLGGTIANEPEIHDFLQTVFALVIDDETLRHRLVTRTNNDWGKQTHELAHSLEMNKELAEQYGKLGYVVIDASQPTDKIIAEILEHIQTDDSE